MAAKYRVLVHPKPFKKQPNKIEMGIVTNDLKRSFSEPIPVTKLLDYAGKGHCIMLCDADIDEDNSFRFISSSLFAIDVDDDAMVTDPAEVMLRLKDKLTGLFYTFSHGLKGNRYRLLFQLDKRIDDERTMQDIIKVVAGDLKEMGLPVDENNNMNPKQIVRGGTKYELISAKNKLNTAELLERVKKANLKRQQELYQEFQKELRPIPFQALKEMAETIGYIASGSGQYALWTQLVLGIKHYANTGFITQDEGFELFDIISGSEQSQRDWERLKARGQVTIGTFIHEALKRGYKGKYTYYGNDETIPATYDHETIKVKDYIPVEVAKELILRNKRILVDSPTGSGKTTAFLNSFKELSNEKPHFFIFAAPTIALTEQNAISHKVRAIKGQTDNLFKIINQDVRTGKRVFISTFDMCPILIDFLKLIEKNMSFTLVVDELHKFVTDYDLNYRFEAIKNLYVVSKQAKSFIGLSGTIDDIYKNEFDQVVTIDNGKPQSPCQEFAVYTYEKKDNALAELAKLIEVWTSKRKLLVYIQSKEKIEQLKTVLRRKGIKVHTINANSKSNHTYKQLVETSQIDEDVQVVLTTSVIADGVNIKNSIDWECLAVCNDFSNLFNYSSIKQISNRLRNVYRRFSIYMQEPKNKSEEPFQLESAYQSRLKIAENIANEINLHPYFDPRLFQTSIVEKRYGIYQGIEQRLEIDTLQLRHAVSQQQERYYSGARYAFINAVERALHTKASGILNISKEIQNNHLEMAFIEQVLGEMQEQKKGDETAKREAIGKVFTREVYQAFVDGDEEILSKFKKEVIASHYSCLSKITQIADYETCLQIVKQVKRNKDTYSFYQSIQLLDDMFYFMALDRPSKTKKAFLALGEVNEFVTNDDYQIIITNMAKKIKLRKEDIEAVEGMYQFENKRSKKERMKRVAEPITVEAIAKQYGLTIEQVKQCALNYAKRKGGTYEKVVRVKLGM